MSEAELGRHEGDLADIPRVIGQPLFFGKGMLVFGLLLSLAAIGAAVVSLMGDNEWLQVGPFAAIVVLCLLGLYLHSRRVPNLSHEIKLQVVLSITSYAVVWIAACGYALAAYVGPSVGAARTTSLYATSIGLLLAFSSILVLNALRSRDRYYCLGLALALLLAGLLIPILDRQYSFPLAHGFLALGYLTVVAIQWGQLRKTVKTSQDCARG